MGARLQIVPGPLEFPLLAGIAATYGRVDRRYQSTDFCHILFNENPFGGSLHGFVWDDESLVGHYAAVPIRIIAGNRLLRSAKGEALFLDESARSLTLQTPTGQQSAGLALMSEVHRRAQEAGAVVLQNVTTPEVGILQRMDGFRRLHIERDQHHFIFDPDRFPSLRNSMLRMNMGRGLAFLQRTCGLLQRRPVSGKGRAVVERLASGGSPPMESCAALTWSDVRWTISRDEQTLGWLARLGRIDIFGLEGRPQQVAVVTGGPSREIVAWALPEGPTRLSLAVLSEIIQASSRGHDAILSVGHDLAMKHSGLRKALRRLAFVRRPFPADLYVRSADPYFLDEHNLAFDRLMNL